MSIMTEKAQPASSAVVRLTELLCSFERQRDSLNQSSAGLGTRLYGSYIQQVKDRLHAQMFVESDPRK